MDMAQTSTFTESVRETPIVESSDVVVCGGGPAGVAAALGAARQGASVRLLEVAGCLGGVWTAGLLSNLIDWENKPGIMAELIAALKAADGWAGNGGVYHAEVMKHVLDRLCLDAGVKVQLHTRVVAAGLDVKRRVRVAISESKSGRQAWAGKVFVDASGDGDFAAHCGCGFDLGHPETGQIQPMSLMGIVTGLHIDAVHPFVIGPGFGYSEPWGRMMAAIQSAGVEPSYAKPTLFRIRDDLFAMMANHQYGVSALDAQQITVATMQARDEIHRIVQALRAIGGVWRDMRVVATADHIGVREGRRIHGRYTVTADDLARGARHEDAVCRATFCVDIHSLDPNRSKAFGSEGRKAVPYDIPLRALIARDVDGLLLAGRCISGDFFAHGSYRVTGNAVAMGEAAGVTAALAAQRDCLPHELAWASIDNQLARLRNQVRDPSCTSPS